MAQIIGKVEELDGKFYLKDENGNIEELQVGDEVKENQIVLGDDKNLVTSRIVIALINSEDTIEVLSNNQLKLDITLLDELPDNDLSSTTKESLADALEKVGEDRDDIPEQEDEPLDIKTKTTEKALDDTDEDLEFDLVDRTAGEIDINSKLITSSSLQNVMGQTNINGLQSGTNEDFGNFVNKTEHETDINTDLQQTDNGSSDTGNNGVDTGLPPLFGTINLTGDSIVNEGAAARYELSVDNAPRFDLQVKLEISHIDTNSGDLTVTSKEATIPAGENRVFITFENNDDLFKEGDENYKVTLVSTNEGGYTELTIGTDEVVTTINDDATTANKETISIKLFAIDATDGSRKLVNEISEDGNPEYIAVAFGKNNNELSVNETVEVTFGAIGDSATANTDYNSTTKTVTLGVKFTTNIIDDYIADNAETYKVQITDNSMSNASSYEKVEIDTTAVTTTILDNSQANTPNNPADDTVELGSDAVVVKIVATDSLGNIISPATIGEGETSYYKAILVDPDGNQIVSATGNVDITFTDDSAIRTGSSANGELDFSATNQTVALNTVFSANALDDYIKDSNETFNVQVVDDTYTNASIYETVIHDVTPVITTIIDGASESDGGNTADDTIFLQLDTNDTVDEENSATLTHQFHLVDKNDNSINLASGETITVTLSYSSDGTESEDFSDKKTTVIITGNGGNTYSFDNTIVDDFLNEGNEAYTVAISSIDTNNTSFENIKIADTSNGANSTVNSASGTIRDGVNDATPNETDNDTVYAVLTGDTTVLEGSSADYTVQLLDIDGNAVTVSQNTVVNVTFTNGTTQDVDTEYSNNQVIPVTILANSSSITLDTDVIDDYMADNSESFTLTISSIPTHEFERIDIDGFTDSGSSVHVGTQTTTITDNTGTPNNDTTDENENSENPALSLDIVEIRLIACDTSGTKLVDGSGNYILANSVFEGDSPNYMALAFVPGTTVFNASTETPTQDGTVDITFFKDTGDTADGISTASTTITPTTDANTHIQDYDIDALSGVSLGVAFSTKVFDDFKSDDGETFSVRIDDGSYTPPTPTTGYENVNIDTTPVVTTISDDVTFGTPDDAYVDEDDYDVTDLSITLTGKEHTTLGGSLDVTGNGTTGNDTLLDITTSPANYNDYTFSFDNAIVLNSDTNTNTSLVSTGDSNFTSAGVNIEYVVSGATITAYKGTGRTASDKVFDIVLEKNTAGGADDGYTYIQYKNIDHPTITGTDDDTLSLTFGYTITNDGQTSQIQNFDVVVNDSLPSATNQTLNVDEDNTLLIIISDESFLNGQITLNNNVLGGDQVISNSGTIDIYDTEGDDVVGTATNNGDGTLTFTPTANYSGGITPFSYITADSDNDGASADIDITVNPIIDAPSISTADISTNEDNSNLTDDGDAAGEHAISLGLTLPALSSDQTDENATATFDHEERLGYITLRFTNGANVIGAEIKNGATTIFTAANNTDTIEIYITNAGADNLDYHYTGLDKDAASVVKLTQAEYEALTITHLEDDDTNINLEISVTSHETDDTGALWNINALATALGINVGDIDVNDLSNTVTESMTIDIQAVTDPISLKFESSDPSYIDDDNYTYNLTENKNEDTVDVSTTIDLASIIADELLGDNDGSESRSFTLTGLPIGTIVTLGTTIVTVADPTPSVDPVPSERGSVTISFPDDTEVNPIFTMELPEHFSTDSDLVIPITLTVQDTDSDLTGTPAILTDTITLTIKGPIVPVADTITLQVSDTTGDEDAGRPNGNIANDSTADDLGNSVYINSNAINLDVNVSSDDTDGSEVFAITITKIPDNGYIYYNGTLLTHTTASSGDFTVTNTGLDSNGNSGWTLKIDNFDNALPFKFIPPHNDDSDYVFDIQASSIDSNGTTTDTQTSSTLQLAVTVNDVADIPVSTTLKTVSVHSNTYNYVINENTLDAASNKFDFDEIYTVPPTTSYDSDSEQLSIVITGLTSDFNVEGATLTGGSDTSREWSFLPGDLSNIKITTPANFNGEIGFQVKYITTETAGDSKTHTPEDIIVLVDPIPTSGDDIIFYAGNGHSIDGLDGSDTLVLAGNSLSFDDIDNIEIIDLGTENNTISGLSLDDVLSMTDSNNELDIIGDSADDVQAVDSTGWTKGTETDNGDSVTYEYSKGVDTVTLTVDDNVNNTGL